MNANPRPSVQTRKPWRFRAACFLAAAAAVVHGGCGGGSGTSAVLAGSPRIVATAPDNGAAGVATDVRLAATFDRPMDPATLNSDTFTLSDFPGSRIAGTVSCAREAVTFTPAAPLALMRHYKATVGTGARDRSGNPLAFPASWNFTTRDGSWGAPVIIGFQGRIPIASVESSGNAVAVWDNCDNAIWANVYTPGSGWGAAARIDADTGPGDLNVSPKVIADGLGNAVAAWEHRNGTRESIRVNRYAPGSGWTMPTAIAGDNLAGCYSPILDSDGQGNVILVRVCSSGGYGIYANRFVAGSGWEDTDGIDTDNATHDSFPGAALMDRVGNAIVVWTRQDWTSSGLSRTYTSGSIWAVGYVAGSGWGSATRIDTDSSNSLGKYWRADGNGDGHIVAAWTQPAGAECRIWATRYVPGPGWGTPTSIETDNVACEYAPAVAVDAIGNALVIWKQWDGTRYSLWENRYVEGSGWSDPVIVVQDAGSTELGSWLQADDAGNAMLTWDRNTPTGIGTWSRRYVPGAGWSPPMAAAGYSLVQNMSRAGNAVSVWTQWDEPNHYTWANVFE